MRDLFSSLKVSLNLGLGVVFGLLAFGQAAQAANLIEKNFYLSGPRYDGNLPACEWALGKITYTAIQTASGNAWPIKPTR